MARYRITTWDNDLGEFTPQIGVPEFVFGFPGLRMAIRLLRAMGYTAEYSQNGLCGDQSVNIERVDDATH